MHDRTLAIPAGGSQLRVRVDFVYTVVPNLVLLHVVNIITDIVLCTVYERARLKPGTFKKILYRYSFEHLLVSTAVAPNISNNA